MRAVCTHAPINVMKIVVFIASLAGGRILYNRGFPVHIRKPYYTPEDALLYTIGGLIIYNRRLYHIR